VPGALDITGTANTAATVSVNNQSTARKAGYFYKELAIDNTTAPQYAQVNVVGARNNFGTGGEDAVTEKGGLVFIPQALEAFSYDLDGNLISDGRWTYGWDAENRLVSMEAIASVPLEAKRRLEFSYDCMARRIQKKVYGWNVAISAYQLQSTTKFVYDGWNLVAEIDGANVLVRSYVRGGGDLLLVNGGSNTYQVGYDGNQNVAVLVSASDGSLSASYDYDPFGRTLKSIGEYASQNAFRFSNQYTDSETGLIYYGYRYYSPQTGRWVNRDPLEEDGGVDLYAFLANNAISSIDLLGLARRQQIREGTLSYSCNCGWIDWGHANSTNAAELWKRLHNTSNYSLTKQGYSVAFGMEAGIKKFGVGISKGVNYTYFVKYNLSTSDLESVGLGIFKEVSERFETSQGGLQDRIMHSSFSEEDLVSNLIGFYKAVRGYSNDDVKKWCKVSTIEFSEWIWDKTGGTKKNRNWTPVFHDSGAVNGGCCDDPPSWPSQFQAIRETPKGNLWRDWVFPTDYFLPPGLPKIVYK
jgi:RHS repeat-associated protein